LKGPARIGLMASDETKLAGNERMVVGDYVNAMKLYTQAISLAPRDASLYSNRSFAFLRLGLPARALADADEAVRRKPSWPKGHFRRAEALRAAGLHCEALASYVRGATLDPLDLHLRDQCLASRTRAAGLERSDRYTVLAGAAAGLVIFALLALAAPSEDGAATAEQRRRHRAPAMGLMGRVLVMAAGAALGAAVGFGAAALRAHGRRGSVLPPTDSNDRFVAIQVHGPGAAGLPPSRGDAAGGGGGFGGFGVAGAAAGGVEFAGGEPGSAGEGAAAAKGGAKHRSVKHGRAAALRAMGK